MSATTTDEAAVEARLQALRQRLGKKQHFEEAVNELAAAVRDRYAGASPALRKSMYSTVCRVATVLQTRYTAPGFWHAGLNLFMGIEKLVTNPAEKEHLKTCISRAHEHLDEKKNEDSTPSHREADNRFLFEGHLTVGQEPPPPAWLVAQNLTRELSILTESSEDQDGNSNRTEPRAEEVTLTPAIMNLLDTISGGRDLETALEESLQGIIELQRKLLPIYLSLLLLRKSSLDWVVRRNVLSAAKTWLWMTRCRSCLASISSILFA